MTLLHEQERLQVAKTACGLLESGLVVNTSGNASIRVDDHIVITPTGRRYEDLEPRDILVLDMQGATVDGDLVPSSETPLHLSVYAADPDIAAIVHTHSVYATAVSTLVRELPAIHYQIADLGGPVPVAPYHTFGTDELASSVTEAIKGRTAALMQNHGAITVAETIDKALAKAVTLEWLARVFLIANRSGTPSLVDDEELGRVSARLDEFADRQRHHLASRQQTPADPDEN